jgi:transposase
MIGISANSRIYLYRGAADMRKGFDGLSGIVREELSEDPMNGTLFIFLNRSRDKIKILYWDRDGYAIWTKRLERGRFALPPEGGGVIVMSGLALLLDGVSVRVVNRSARWTKAA